MQSGDIFRDRPLGRPCTCDVLFREFKWRELHLLRSSDLPKASGVYALRVIERGEDLEHAFRRVLDLVEATGWGELVRYVRSRLARLSRIANCPVIYVGSTGGKKGKGGLRSRLKDLAGRRHTTFFPVLALLAAGWKIDFGFVTCETPEEARRLEEEIKRRYEEIHETLPALVER